MGVRLPLLFLHPLKTRRADVVARAKGNVIPVEVPRHLLGDRRESCGVKEGRRFYVLGGMDLSLRLLLVAVVDVTRRHGLGLYEYRSKMRFNFFMQRIFRSFHLQRITGCRVCPTG